MFFARDNRTGIDPSQHQEVFGLFQKVNKKSEELALALAIVNRIIEVIGRIMRIEPGRGKVPCMFSLPLKKWRISVIQMSK
jgi:light-regulated signal transduction histidine kinase (bacteriophytochrome)